MSQLYPVNFISSTQSLSVEQMESTENSTSATKASTIAFRPIIPKVLTKNVLSATHDNMQQLSNSNTNGLLSTGDSQDYSSMSLHLTSTYRSLSYVKPSFFGTSSSTMHSSSVESRDLPVFDDGLPASSTFFSVSGSTYRRPPLSSNTPNSSNRYRLCLTVSVLEHLHEVSLWPLNEAATSTNGILDVETNRQSCGEISG